MILLEGLGDLLKGPNLIRGVLVCIAINSSGRLTAAIIC
jgi:hypothetical protein